MTLLTVDLANARPRQQTDSTSIHQHSRIINDGKVLNDNQQIITASSDHVINKREQAVGVSNCRPRLVRKVMNRPMLSFKLDEGPLNYLSFGAPKLIPYQECDFNGCTDEEIEEFKQINKRTKVTFEYDSLPTTYGEKPDYKLTFTKYFTQCEKEESTTSMPEIEEKQQSI